MTELYHHVSIGKPVYKPKLVECIKYTMGYDMYKKQCKLADDKYTSDAHKLFDGMTSIIKRKNYTHNDNVYK